MTEGILVSRRKKNLLLKISLKSRDILDKSAYTTYRNIYNRVVRSMKKLYFDNQFSKHCDNLKETWKTLKLAIRKEKTKNSTILSINVNGVTISDSKIMAEKFNEHFTYMAKKISEKIIPTDRPPDLNAPISNVLLNLKSNPISSKEFLDQVKNLKNKNSSDSCGLSSSLLKKIAPLIVSPLLHVFNNSITSGVVPHQFKCAKIIPIFKCGDASLVDNYRPISLLSTLSKLLEKIICSRLTEHLEHNNLLTPSQFGFRSGLNTTQPMIHFLNKLCSAGNNNEFSIAVFCDLQKAFDCCDHKILLKKLNNLGVRGTELDWFASYLTGRTQFVEINSCPSPPLEILCGVPQGSILGPILFLAYINDLPLASKLFSSLFADDTTLLASNKCLTTLVSFVNQELQKIVEYFRANKLLLHPAKTQFILFHPSLQPIEASCVNLFLNNNNINSAQSPDYITRLSHVDHLNPSPAIKFLGVHFDPSLSFGPHIKKLTAKISSSLFIIKSVKKLVSPEALKSLYFSMVHCHLIYGLNVWSSASDNQLKNIILKQKQAIRIISNSPYNSHTEPLFKQLNILPLPSLIELHRIQFMHNVKFNPSYSDFSSTWPINETLMPLQRSLRNSLDFNIPHSRTTTISRLPLSTFPTTWNLKVSEESKEIWKMSIFSKKIKNTLVAKLDTSVTCSRIGCSQCHH